MRRSLTVVSLAAAATLAVGPLPRLQAQTAGAPGVVFSDVTSASGITFRHTNGAFGKKYLPETMGSGVVFFDFDGDGAQDLFFVNSTRFAGPPREAGPARALPERRQGPLHGRDEGGGPGGRDVRPRRRGRRLRQRRPRRPLRHRPRPEPPVPQPGRRDVRGRDREGRRRATPASRRAPCSSTTTRTAGSTWWSPTTSTWSIEKDLFCTLDGKSKSYCTPESYKGQSLRLYRGLPGGVFEDATKKAGLEDARAKSLGLALIDFDSDSWPDLFVANDTQPNKLYKNNGNGSFSDVGVAAGVAFGETGVARAGMGTDAADYSGSGRPSLLIGNFSNEMLGLYHNEGNGLFIDEAPSSTVGQASLLTLSFAAFFFDFDLDGKLDIFSVGGHVADDIQKVQPKVSYAQPPHLFRNLGNKRFEDVVARVGPALARPMVSRGAAYADVDGDGDLDLAVTANGGPAVLLRNDGGNKNAWLRVRLVGTKSNRDGIGARVSVTLPGGGKSWGVVKTGSSYCSQSELPLTFGLGAAKGVEAVEVAWPSGQVDRLGPQAAGRTSAPRTRGPCRRQRGQGAEARAWVDG